MNTDEIIRELRAGADDGQPAMRISYDDVVRRGGRRRRLVAGAKSVAVVAVCGALAVGGGVVMDRISGADGAGRVAAAGSDYDAQAMPDILREVVNAGWVEAAEVLDQKDYEVQAVGGEDADGELIVLPQSRYDEATGWELSFAIGTHEMGLSLMRSGSDSESGALEQIESWCRTDLRQGNVVDCGATQLMDGRVAQYEVYPFEPGYVVDPATVDLDRLWFLAKVTVIEPGSDFVVVASETIKATSRDFADQAWWLDRDELTTIASDPRLAVGAAMPRGEECGSADNPCSTDQIR